MSTTLPNRVTRHRPVVVMACAVVLLLGACGTGSDEAAPLGPPASADATDSTGETQASAASDPAEPPASDAVIVTPPAETVPVDGPIDVPVDVTVTASGSGGCIDSVQTSALDVLGGSGDEVWATFDLVLDNNCGDPGRTVEFDRPAAGSGADGWRRSDAGDSVAIAGPVCNDRVECSDDQRVVELDAPADVPVGFELFRDDTDADLIASSPFEVDIAGRYPYDVATLDDDPVDIVVTVTVTEPLPTPSGDSTPIDTGGSPVRVVGGGFDLLTFPLAGYADTREKLIALLAPSVQPAEPAIVDSIDWASEAAVVFAIPTDLCPPVLTDLAIEGDVATPVFENPGYAACEQPRLSHTVIAAVDRELLTDVTEVRLDPGDPYFDVAATASVAVTPGIDSAPPTPPVIAFGTVSGSVELPATGEAVVGTLDDGAPIYVVHHRDGTVSAIDPRAGSPLEAPPAILAIASWNAADRNFMARGVWDEYGRRVDGSRSTDMVGRATRVADRDGAAVVEIGDTVEPPIGSPITITDSAPAMTDASVDLADPIGFEDALALDVGTSVVIDASIVVDPSGAFICSQVGDGFPIPPCREGSPTLDGVAAIEGSRNVFYGPLLVTRSDTGFERVAASGGQAGEAI